MSYYLSTYVKQKWFFLSELAVKMCHPLTF